MTRKDIQASILHLAVQRFTMDKDMSLIRAILDVSTDVIEGHVETINRIMETMPDVGLRENAK